MIGSVQTSSPSWGEILLSFDEPVVARDQTAYRARACGGKAGDGIRRWHGWIEFEPVRGGPVIRTPRETTQRNRADTAMWATGRTRVYFEGALHRALDTPSGIGLESPTSEAPAIRNRFTGFSRVGG